MNHLGIFINNTDTIIRYNVNLNNYNKLKKNFSNIIIFDNNSKLSIELKSVIQKSQNEQKDQKENIIKYILNDGGKNDHSDFNIEKLYNILKIVQKKYDYITIMSDNYVYYNSLEDYFKYIYLHNYDFYSYTDSSEYFYHYQLNLFTFNGNKINDILLFLKSYKNNNILKDFPNIFEKKISYIKVAYVEINYEQNIYFNHNYVKYLIENNIIGIINILFLNELIKKRKQNYISIPEYFDINIYRNHPDLKNYDDNFLMDHFLNNGQYEVRDYKKNNYLLPECIRNRLLECENLIDLFDLPENFSMYNYKNKNKELSGLGPLDLMVHYIEKGRYEGKSY